MGDYTFLLVGNGSYLNRGCEAIVRGTIHILQHHFGAPRFHAFSAFQEANDLRAQQENEKDPAIAHDAIWRSRRRFDGAWFAINALKRIHPGLLKHLFYKDLKPHLARATAVLAVGGDNYTLDYTNRPIVCTELDDLVASRGKPLIIWGASVGPFSKDPAYEMYMIRHLQKVHIFARESFTLEYLNQRGLVKNVYKVADPAFLLEPVEPRRDKIAFSYEEGGIGINLSPLLAKYSNDGNLREWTAKAAKIIQSIISATGRPIYLIPHVSSDFPFLQNVASLLDCRKNRLFLVPDTLDAAETKWIISKMDVFIGARTHATIAALSSCVPTLLLGYSIKSFGISRDLYGSTEYCLQAKPLDPEVVCEKTVEILARARRLRQWLGEAIPRMQDQALRAGGLLRTILNTQYGKI